MEFPGHFGKTGQMPYTPRRRPPVNMALASEHLPEQGMEEMKRSLETYLNSAEILGKVIIIVALFALEKELWSKTRYEPEGRKQKDSERPNS